MLIWPKNFFFTKFEYGYQNNSEFYAGLESVEKNAKNLQTKKLQAKSVQNWSLASSILLTCTSFWQITFSRYTFFKLFPRIWNQRKILRFFYTHMLKKKLKNFGVMEYIYEYFLEILECKFARNGLTNWKTFLTNILKYIIWHLFAGESHQVVKITVPYCIAAYLHWIILSLCPWQYNQITK